MTSHFGCVIVSKSRAGGRCRCKGLRCLQKGSASFKRTSTARTESVSLDLCPRICICICTTISYYCSLTWPPLADELVRATAGHWCQQVFPFRVGQHSAVLIGGLCVPHILKLRVPGSGQVRSVLIGELCAPRTQRSPTSRSCQGRSVLIRDICLTHPGAYDVPDTPYIASMVIRQSPHPQQRAGAELGP